MTRFLAAFITTAIACGTAGAAARFTWPSPAQNFSAYYYRSPGGIGRALPMPAVYRWQGAGNAVTVPHPQSCGSGRTWDGQRCVGADARK